ncbi:MAG: ABC transporter permease [Solirubrobacterales bacterium]
MSEVAERLRDEPGGEQARGRGAPAGLAPPGRVGTVRRVARVVLPPLAVSAFTIAAWELAVAVFDVSPLTLAAPSAIAQELSDSRELLADASWITTQEIVYGFALSAVVGAALAILVGALTAADRALYPLIVAFQNIPKVALAPIFVLWFGYGVLPKMLLIAVIAFFPVTVNMRAGMNSVDPNLLQLARSVGASRLQILTRLQLPSSLPYLFAGLRIAITFSVIGAVVAEFAGASQGLGYLIQFASTQLDTPLVFAGLVVISMLGLALFYLVSLLEWLVARRYPQPQALATGA